MRSLRTWRFRNTMRVAAAATLAATVVGGGGVAGAADRRLTDVAPTATTTIGDLKTTSPLIPPAPQRLTSSGLSPLGRDEANRLTGGGRVNGTSCDIDFDDDAAIAWIPGGALDTFVLSPFWNQLCGSKYARVYPTDTNHLHLGYVDASIGLCSDPDNPNGTPLGTFSRGEDCEPIDPVTEPRSSITVGHYADRRGRLDLIDANGFDDTPRPFTLERMRILSGPARVCYRMPPEGPWEAAEPVGPFDEPGLVYCWASLSPGLWDLSVWTAGTVAVDFTGASGILPGYDDFRLG